MLERLDEAAAFFGREWYRRDSTPYEYRLIRWLFEARPALNTVPGGHAVEGGSR